MDGYTVQKFYLTDDQYNYLHSIFYEKAGVHDLETYFEEYNEIPSEDPGGILSMKLFDKLTTEFNSLYKQSEPVTEDEYVLVSFCVDKTTKHRLMEKFESITVLEEEPLQDAHLRMFEQLATDEFCNTIPTVY